MEPQPRLRAKAKRGPSDGNGISERRNPARPYKNQYHQPTCFQSRRPRANAPAPRWRMRSKPTSMATSKKKSVTNIEIKVAILLLRLGRLQSPSDGSHTERIYRWISSPAPNIWSRFFTLMIPNNRSRLTGFQFLCRRMVSSLPYMRNDTLVTHTTVASTTMPLLLFQMAMLVERAHGCLL